MSGGYRDIYSGVLHKCGGRIKTWTKRWMVLRSDYCLYYYKDATKNHLGVISLRDTQFKIRVGQKSDVTWPKNLALENTFALVTTPRVYFMYADTKAEADEWRKVLEDAHHDLLEVTRTKSFSGFRSASLAVDRDTALTSQSLREPEEGSLVGGLLRPKAHSSVCDSLASNASSAFGRQFTLSLSSETGLPLAPVQEVESMYNVLQHPLVQVEEKAGPKVEEEEKGGEEGEERLFLNEALYSQLPPPSGVVERESVLSESERDYDYVLPPDADTPQNFSITVSNGDQQRWAEPRLKGLELLEKGSGSATSSQTSLEAFYDFAREAGSNDKQTHKQQQEEELGVYDVVRPENSSVTPPTQNKSTRAPPKPNSAVAQPLPAIPAILAPNSSLPPPSSRTLDQGMIYEDVPDVPKTKRETAEPPLPVYDVVDTARIIHKSKQDKEPVVAVYDVLEHNGDTRNTIQRDENSVVGVYDVLTESGTSAVYEPVGDAGPEEEEEEEEEEEMYSEVGFEERTPPLVKGSVGRYVNVPPTGGSDETKEEVTGSGGRVNGDYVNVSHSGETPPLPAQHTPPSPHTEQLTAATPTDPPTATPTAPPTSTPTAPPTATPRVCNEDSCLITRPQPKPRTNTRPRTSDQSPSNSNTVEQSPSNNSTVDPSPSNRDSPPSSSPPLPSHASSEQIPIPGHDRSDSTSSDPFPPSPSSLPSYQRKFSPPTSPRSPRSPRPPSPLLSDRRISGSARNSSPHSSTSSSPGDDGYLATATRQRSTSLKEKGIALFQRRQHEVASHSAEDSQRRKRSLSMLKGLQEDDTLSSDDKILFAETLREVGIM
ncbi:hypothetical protein GBAR_LOCUS24590 [Geodia barretti]|uniref:PH domain-containing protein n=1 Tax=Geodia barretti TaxID=519541 RepID=A0AA35X4X7_GEOBA|nr:hypothetical protein GBAR_LOCUS24590 [Geodia barretti]